MLDHGASAFEREKGETSVLSFRTVLWFQASGFDPMPIVRAPSISRGAAMTSDVVRGRGEEDAGEAAAGSEVSSLNARRAGANRENGGEKGSMDGTRSPQTKS